MQEQASKFATAVYDAFAQRVRGQAEEQLKRPVSEFIEDAGLLFNIAVRTTPEIVHDAGRPDIGILVGGLLSGFVELKAPGETIVPQRMRGHNRKQWNKFRDLPNLLYTNSCDWALYERGELIASCTFESEPVRDGDRAINEEKAEELGRILRRFLNWMPLVPTRPREFAQFLAPFTRVLRDDVLDAVQSRQQNLIALRDEWRAYLFPNFSDAEFADAYAQTVTSALLLARLEGADVLDPRQAEQFLRGQNTLLGRILQILTQDDVREDIKLGLGLIQRVLAALDVVALQRAQPDPWLYFYEDFLHAYDPSLAKDAGVYYTPAQVVHCQTRFVSHLLQHDLRQPYSFASDGVTVLDPAVGTGTYLVAAIQHALPIIQRRAGEQRRARAAILAQNLVGFELLIGPYAVAHLRLARELLEMSGEKGERLPLRVYLTDTLESPNTPLEGTLVPLNDRPLVQERENARQVKATERVWVCIGNPPYDRQMEQGAERKGGWVRFGDQTQDKSIFEDFLEPARTAGQGANIRSIYNDYVYFWRWALWKVFEGSRAEQNHPGIVSFITGSSYLAGPGFVGMREYMRKCFDQIWILDLGGDSLGARRDANVFAIQTPVAIAIGIRVGDQSTEVPAAVHYARIAGTREEKLSQLDDVHSPEDLVWKRCPDDWQAPFKPALQGPYSTWPSIGQLFPWQHNGIQFVRTWPIGPTREVLERRWANLLEGKADERKSRLKESRDRTVDWRTDRPGIPGTCEPAISSLPSQSPSPTPIRIRYRTLDRQWALYDARLGDYLKPPIFHSHGRNQIYLSTLLSTAIGLGPAATFTADIPDLHHFRGSFGGKDLIPLYRDSEGSTINLTSGLVEILRSEYGSDICGLDVFCYVAGIVGLRTFTNHFWDELSTPGLRIPLTKEYTIFERVSALGRRVIALQTFEERLSDEPYVIAGRARVAVDIPNTTQKYPESFAFNQGAEFLSIGDGGIADVSADVWQYEVSGLRVVDSWLSYRMKKGAGKKTSPLDDIRPLQWTAGLTEELLEVIWTIEALVGLEAQGRHALLEVLGSRIFESSELPVPREDETEEPRITVHGMQMPLVNR